MKHIKTFVETAQITEHDETGEPFSDPYASCVEASAFVVSPLIY